MATIARFGVGSRGKGEALTLMQHIGNICCPIAVTIS